MLDFSTWHPSPAPFVPSDIALPFPSAQVCSGKNDRRVRTGTGAHRVTVETKCWSHPAVANRGMRAEFKQLRKAECGAHVCAGRKHMVHCARTCVSCHPFLLTVLVSLAPSTRWGSFYCPRRHHTLQMQRNREKFAEKALGDR